MFSFEDSKPRKKFKVTLTQDGSPQSISLTPDEANQLGFWSPLEQKPFPLSQLIRKLFGQHSEAAVDPESQSQCQFCGLDYESFLTSGRFGCGQCYQAFREPLQNIMTQLHGSNQHNGAEPTRLPDSLPISTEPEVVPDEQELLKSRLEKAVSDEDYELAARLRDEMGAQVPD